MKKQYWFYIDTFVYMAVSGPHTLLYNPLNGKHLEYRDNPALAEWVLKLEHAENFRVDAVFPEDFDIPWKKSFMEDVRDNIMGDWFDASLTALPPIQMSPTVKVNKDLKYLKGSKQRSVGERHMDYLSRFTLHISNTCRQTCSDCSAMFRQAPGCGLFPGDSADVNLSESRADKLIKELGGCRLNELTITGGNIFLHEKWERLFERLSRIPANRIACYVHYLNIPQSPQDQRLLAMRGGSAVIRLMITLPVLPDELRRAWSILTENNIPVEPVCFIADESGFDSWNAIRTEFNRARFYIYPLYNGRNMDFLKQTLFISREDILAKRPQTIDIHRNRTLNADGFGHLLMTANGDIFSNIHDAPLGNIDDFSIYDAVYMELAEGNNWLAPRNKFKPCGECPFNGLCPPISNYNRVTNRYDLCHIWGEYAN